MNKIRLEHANITVRDYDQTIRFLTSAFPHFQIRGRDGNSWIHIGDDSTYFCLCLNPNFKHGHRNFEDIGINHIGVEVDDVDKIADRLRKDGFREGKQPDSHKFRKRIYFYDPNEIEWEFIQYFSDDPKKRNEYNAD